VTGAPLGRLVVLEWRAFAAGRGGLALVAALAAICAFAVWGGVVRTAETRAAQSEAVREAADSWADKRAKFLDLQAGRLDVGMFVNPARADLAVMSHRVPLALPPAPLAPLSAGPAREDHDIVEVGMATRHGRGGQTLENPANRLDGPLDMAFVVAWLVPVVLLVLSYDVLAVDREKQVSPLLASAATPLGRIVLARLLVRFVAVFGVVGAVGAAGVLAAAGPRGPVGVLPDLAVWLLALALFVAFWLALAAAVNARARNAAAAGVTLLAAWITLSLVVPVAAAQWVAAGTPPPDRLAYVLQFRAIQTDLAERAAEVREAFYAERPERRPTRPSFSEYEAYFVETYYPRQRMLDRRFGPIARELHTRQAAQAERLRQAAVFSPPLAIKRLTDDLAGFAPERRLAFYDAVDGFQAAWRERFDVKLAARVPLVLADYDRPPSFQHQDEPVGDRLARNATPLAGLLLGFLSVALLARARLRRAGP